MASPDKVNFYFWTHGCSDGNYNQLEVLDTPIFNSLMDRSDYVFCEFTAPDISLADNLEKNFNTFIKTGYLDPKSAELIDWNQNDWLKFILGRMYCKDKKLILEKSLGPDFDYLEEDLYSLVSIFVEPLETAIEERGKFLSRVRPYQLQREKNVSEQITSCSGEVTVLFGAGHRNLERLVSKKSDTEIYYPFPDFRISNGIKCEEYYDETGIVDPELFLAHFLEGLVQKALFDCKEYKFTNQQMDLITDYYVSLFTQEKIMEYKDIFADNRINFKEQYESFKSYLAENNFPSIPEVMAEKGL